MMSGSETSMDRLPFFRFFPGEFLSSEIAVGFDNVELGGYMRLLAFSWLNRGLPKDRKMLARISQLGGKELEHVLSVGFSSKDGDRLKSAAQEEERAWALDKSRKAQESIRSRWAAREGSPCTPSKEAEETREDETREDEIRQEQRTADEVRTKYGRNTNVSNNGGGFDRFWQAYPYKRSKQNARANWMKLNPNAELQARILSAIAERIASGDWCDERRQYIPSAAMWLYEWEK